MVKSYLKNKKISNIAVRLRQGFGGHGTSGCGAVRLAHHVRDVGAAGSNPVIPTWPAEALAAAGYFLIRFHPVIFISDNYTIFVFYKEE